MGTSFLLRGCCHYGDNTTTGDTSMVTGDTATIGGYHCYRDAATMGMLLPRESCLYSGTTAMAMGDTAAMILPPWGTSPPLWGHHCHGDAATATTQGTLTIWGPDYHCEAPRGTTLLILLRPLEEGELAGVVDDGELAEEGVDDLAGAGVREDVQVLDGPFGQVEGRAALHPLGVWPPRLQGGDPLGGRH